MHKLILRIGTKVIRKVRINKIKTKKVTLNSLKMNIILMQTQMRISKLYIKTFSEKIIKIFLNLSKIDFKHLLSRAIKFYTVYRITQSMI